MRHWRSVATLAVASCAACGGYQVPPQHVTGAQTAIAAARGGGADADPQAALHLKLAEEQYSGARNLMQQRESKQADLMLLRSQADAQLAQTLAQKTTATAQTQQTVEQIRALTQSQQPMPRQ
jgi:Domain of unknown function (DUF4398)